MLISVSADELWKGVVGVSNAGKKKGRGKRVGRKKVTDLNKGQFIGEGKNENSFLEYLLINLLNIKAELCLLQLHVAVSQATRIRLKVTLLFLIHHWSSGPRSKS